MLENLTQILIYSLIACVVTAFSFPYYIRLLRYLKAGKTIREDSGTGDKSVIFTALHKHK
jgi:UDP-N-acetylmuramyl pentapeptide phosphotransferase/UDP-N-acetylglucosamine-1-phosphate transferase